MGALTERHDKRSPVIWPIVSTVLSTLLVALIIYVSGTLVSIREDLATLRADLRNLSADVLEGAANRWTVKDHAGYAALIDNCIRSMSVRLDTIESDMKKIIIKEKP